MIGMIVPVHVPEALGAPFRVELLDCVTTRAGGFGIPDAYGMSVRVGLARLRRDRRLSGADLLFVRKAAMVSRDALSRALGAAKGEVEIYERDGRPMTVAVEKYVRLHLHHALLRLDAMRDDGGAGRGCDGPARADAQQALDYLGWVLDGWSHGPSGAQGDLVVRLRHSPTGWREVDG